MIFFVVPFHIFSCCQHSPENSRNYKDEKIIIDVSQYVDKNTS